MKRHLSFWVMILAALVAQAQRVGEWTLYPAGHIATQNLTVGSRVYALMSQNLVCYDTSDESVQIYDRSNALNDTHIACMAYSAAARRLILIYENSNIDLLSLDDEAVNISALKESSVAGKEVASVRVEGSMAYLATGFGFLTVDMAEGVIRDTYRLGFGVKGVLPQDDAVYLATDGNQVVCAAYTDNWHLADSWKATTAVAPAVVCATTTEYNPAGGFFWHSDGLQGLRGYRQDADGQYQLATGSIQPDSPVRDLCYRMSYVGDRLLVAGGINTPYAIYHPATAMYYDGGTWTNLDEETFTTQFAGLCHWNTTHLVQDPQDPTHHFASPYRTGLYEYRNAKLEKIYSDATLVAGTHLTPSPLRQISNYGRNYVSAAGLQFDEAGNLWMCNQQTDTIIRILTPTGKWHALYYPEIEGAPTCDDYLFTTSGTRFLVSRRMGQRGFFAFDTNGTLNSTRDDKHRLLQTIVNEDGTSYSPDQFYCLAEDMTGQVWCGTQLGLFVIEDPTQVFADDFRFLQIKIARDDGSGLADYLLSGLAITCIAVDAANRKWIGTDSNGLYLVSADGQQLLQHFRADESPLLSDNIQCLAIHPASGLLMIGTDKGLCSYMPDAKAAEEELDSDDVLVYPNPVRPDYRGPITIDGLVQDTEVKICSSTGQLLWTGRSNGGRCVWNGQNQRGQHVSSGVYNVVANTPDGKKAIVTRVVVIK